MKRAADKILIITQKEDGHVPFVEKYLQSPVQILDPADAIHGKELSYAYYGKELHITFGGNELRGIKSVWYRKPAPIWGDTLPIAPQHRHYSESAVLALTRELYAHFSDAFWMSDYYALRRANHKGFQMEVASSLGFQIPETVITADEQTARAFIDKHPATVIKSLASNFPNTESGQTTMFYTRLLHRGDKINFSGLHLAPILLQEAIDFVEELRITVVGEKVFCAAMRASGLETMSDIRDWRPAHFYGALETVAYRLEKDMREKCVALVRRLGLAYGAIDILKDVHGIMWFLEINPNGQWAFVEDETGQPIGKAIAEQLEKGAASIK